MGKNTCECNVGRLLEIRVGRGYETVADVDEMIGMMSAVVAKMPADVKHVTAADWRRCSLMSAEAAERVTTMFVRSNPRTELSAILYSNDSPTAVLQVVRLLNEGGNSNRRMFVSSTQMQAFLSDVLSEQESARLRAFLQG